MDSIGLRNALRLLHSIFIVSVHWRGGNSVSEPVRGAPA
jgi:hypothetical protein